MKSKPTLKKRLKKLVKNLRKLYNDLFPKQFRYDKTVVQGYVGRWSDGTPGHGLPYAAGRGWAAVPEVSAWQRGPKRVWKAKITIEILKDKNGKYMTKVVQPKGQ